MAYLFPAGPHIPEDPYGCTDENTPMKRYRRQINALLEVMRDQHSAEFGEMNKKHGPVLQRGDTLDPVLASHLGRKTY